MTARFVRVLGFVLLLLAPLSIALGDDVGLSDNEILGKKSPTSMTLQSLRMRVSSFEQDGRGYQSQADRPNALGKGSEYLLVYQPQLEMIATQGDFTHRLWVPVDIVTAASPDAIDAMSGASRQNEAASFDFSTRYRATPETAASMRAAVHAEEPFRSFQLGAGLEHSFADDNAVLSASANQAFDEFDQFDIHGVRLGRVFRSSTNANLGLSQLLSETTVGYLNYGFTAQAGELSNTWNAVPLASGLLGRELLPRARYRHALSARIAQALPWQGALHAAYRFYADSWQVLAHTLDASLLQRLTRALYLRFGYRFHAQRAPFFWAAPASTVAEFRTADSDLATLRAQTIGGALVLDLDRVGGVRGLHVDLGYDRYFRSNDLRVNIFTCGLGFRF